MPEDYSRTGHGPSPRNHASVSASVWATLGQRMPDYESRRRRLRAMGRRPGVVIASCTNVAPPSTTPPACSTPPVALVAHGTGFVD